MATYARTDTATYWTDGAPSSLVCELESDLDMTAVTSAEAELVDPDGIVIPGTTATVDGAADPPTVTIAFPGAPFTVGGLYEVWLTLTAPTFVEVVDPVQLVVQSRDGWLTLDQARRKWPQAPDDDVELYELLDAARGACEEFLEGIDEAEQPRATSKRNAQFQQARASWIAMSSTVERVGDEEFSVQAFPLDWHVKQLLRPHGAPAMY